MRTLNASAIAALTVVLVLSGTRQAGGVQSNERIAPLTQVIENLAKYVVRFEHEFSSAVAEERYVQLLRPSGSAPRWPSRERALEWDADGGEYPRTGTIFDRRQLLSDVLLVQTPEGWLGYRDVAEVDGRPVRERGERVTRLFLAREANRSDALARIARESARHNLGDFHRTLNIPTLALSLLHRRHHFRYRFEEEKDEALDGRLTRVLQFTERHRPTLIGTPKGGDVPISGRVWIERSSGAVVQTELAAKPGDRRVTLVTRYRSETGFEVLVPDYMWEWYDAGSYLGGRRSTGFRLGTGIMPAFIECLARYTAYRRFSVTTQHR